jgi:hypothetical protein
MTSDEHRAACIEAMCKARYESDCVFAHWEEESEDFKENYRRKETFALDSLHDIARVVPVEATEEMHVAAKNTREADKTRGLPTPWGKVWRVMSAAGDLTNPQERKP